MKTNVSGDKKIFCILIQKNKLSIGPLDTTQLSEHVQKGNFTNFWVSFSSLSEAISLKFFKNSQDFKNFFREFVNTEIQAGTAINANTSHIFQKYNFSEVYTIQKITEITSYLNANSKNWFVDFQNSALTAANYFAVSGGQDVFPTPSLKLLLSKDFKLNNQLNFFLKKWKLTFSVVLLLSVTLLWQIKVHHSKIELMPLENKGSTLPSTVELFLNSLQTQSRFSSHNSYQLLLKLESFRSLFPAKILPSPEQVISMLLLEDDYQTVMLPEEKVALSKLFETNSSSNLVFFAKKLLQLKRVSDLRSPNLISPSTWQEWEYADFLKNYDYQDMNFPGIEKNSIKLIQNPTEILGELKNVSLAIQKIQTEPAPNQELAHLLLEKVLLQASINLSSTQSTVQSSKISKIEASEAQKAHAQLESMLTLWNKKAALIQKTQSEKFLNKQPVKIWIEWYFSRIKNELSSATECSLRSSSFRRFLLDPVEGISFALTHRIQPQPTKEFALLLGEYNQQFKKSYSWSLNTCLNKNQDERLQEKKISWRPWMLWHKAFSPKLFLLKNSPEMEEKNESNSPISFNSHPSPQTLGDWLYLKNKLPVSKRYSMDCSWQWFEFEACQVSLLQSRLSPIEKIDFLNKQASKISNAGRDELIRILLFVLSDIRLFDDKKKYLMENSISYKNAISNLVQSMALSKIEKEFLIQIFL